MKLFVYKGFSADFLATLTVLPLVDSEIPAKKNVLFFDNKMRRRLDRALLSMDDDEEFWISYEEYALLKDRVELAAKDYGLEVVIYTNNLYPEYYPIEFDLNEELLEEIRSSLNLKIIDEQSTACKNFLSVYNSLETIDGEHFASFYNYEFEKGLKVTVIPYYPTASALDSMDTADLHVHITNDIPMFLKELTRIRRMQPHSIGYSITKGLLSDRNLSALRAYCHHYGIGVCERPMPSEQSRILEEQLIRIAKNDVKIPNFESFRQLRFYKNPDINNNVVEISQAQIISDIITQAENAYADPHDYRDIFITASTGAGKSVMFQIPAIYLAQKHKKLTIIIEPVKALMQDQKEQLNARGFHRVETFNSDLISQAEKEEVLNRVKNGETDLLYLSPETLLSYSMETLIGDREIGLIIVDEAHIVTTWGVGFRPDYWYLGSYIYRLRNQIQTKWNKNKKIAHFPICAFTATAVNGGLDDSVSETIISLYMQNPIKYIGYVKRDNIRFDISIKESRKLANSVYEGKKATDMISRINDWIATGTKTVAYFPYASYAADALSGVNSFSGKAFERGKVAIYTGKNIDDIGAAEQAERKRKAFEEFRSGQKPVMLATKAFGMGVDINNIENVYHYAASGNLCDYVQEIGRAARKDGMIGHAITDYYYNDISFMERLFGMSQIRQHQINLVLSGIYNTYKSKNENRSFLISPESFTYIFTGRKDARDDERKRLDKQINKLKTCLLMLEKDLYDKYNFKVLVSRPQGIFTKAYVVIDKDHEKRVLNSKFGKYFTYVAPGRVQEAQSGSNVTVSDIGDIFYLDLKAVWEDHYPNLSFPQFKYWYFNKNSTSKEKVEIMPAIRDYFSIRQKVSLETKNDLILSNIQAKILEDFDYIADTLYATFKRSHFTLEEFAKAISPKYGATKARIIANSLFPLVDPDARCAKPKYETSQYHLANGTFKEVLNRSITRSPLIKNLAANNNTSLSKFMPLSPESKDAVALKLLSIFDYATYEVAGGEQPEIFIRLNDPEKVRRIVFSEIKYSNSYVTRARQKHERDVKVLRKFFTDSLSDEARWDYVERYFLGEDVLCEAESVPEEKVPFSKFIDKERSYPTNEDSWDKIAFLFDENAQSIIESLTHLGIPVPDYLTPAVRHNLIDGEISMSWSDKNILVFSEAISQKDAAICAKKGWHAFELLALEPDKVKEIMG